MNNRLSDLSTEEKKEYLQQFFDNLADVLASHTDALNTLQKNQTKLAEAFEQLSTMNNNLIQAIMRNNNSGVN